MVKNSIMLLKLVAKFSLLLLFIVLTTGYVLSQTTPLSFTSIPFSDADLNAPGRGVEQWHDQNLVNVPTEGVNTQRLDVYHRFVWTKIEGPTMGSYTWRFFDSLVNDAIVRKQKLSFGIMPLYPGGTTQQGLVSFGGGLASYPLYLHNLMQAEPVKDWISGSVWTPNYNSINYQNRLLALHQAIDAHIKSTSFNGVPYKNVISCIDIRGYGAWGEWHSGYTKNNVISDYPAGTFPSVATLKKIVDAHTQGFPDFPLVAMISAFDANFLQNTMNPPEIAYYILTQRNSWGLIGWRRDQWGATDSYIANYLENNTRSFNGLMFKDSIMVRWKSAPITGEPPGWNPNNFSDLERQVKLYHATSFGNGNYGTSPTSTIKSRVRAASKACGYRLIIEGGNMNASCRNISITLNWKNIGQAPTYENWDVSFELKSGNTVVWTGASLFKPRLFLPATSAKAVTDNFTLPAGLPTGTYNFNVIIRDPNGYRNPLPLAINGRNEDGSYTVAQISIPGTPVITVVDNCGSSVLTATGAQGGTFLWNTGATTSSITVTQPGTYSVTQTVNGCTSDPASVTVSPLASNVPAPDLAIVNNCGNSVLTATGVQNATFLWSTGQTGSSITVTTGGTYTVTQKVNGCISPARSGVATPKVKPVLSSNLSASVTSGSVFSYNATTTTPNTTLTWSRATASGISNAAASGIGDINETLVNTTSSPVNVTYVYTLSTSECTNSENVVVTVNPNNTVTCVVNGSISSSFNSTSIAANRTIWFSSVINPGKLSNLNGVITFTITNGTISFTANGQQYTLSVPNSKIRFDGSASNATTQFVNNAWETTIPKNNNGFVFLAGLSYLVPANLPGNISNVTWSAKISIDRANITPTWKWAASVYTTLGSYSAIGVKPRDNKDKTPFNNSDKAGTPELYKSFLVAGAKGTGGSNYTGDYSSTSSATCSTTGQRSSETPVNEQMIVKQVSADALVLPENEALEAAAIPNPAHSSFNLFVKGKRSNLVSVKVIDISGRVVERHDKILPNTIFNLGGRLAAGSYFIEVIQGGQKKTISVMKVN